MKRWLLIILLLLAFIAAIPFAALQSETLTRWVLPELLRLAPGKIEAVHASGALAGPLELRDIHWQQDDRDLKISRLLLDWEPLALWTGELSVLELETGAVTVDWPSREAPDPTAPDLRELLGQLELPLEIRVGRLSLDSLAIAQLADLGPLGIAASDLALTEDMLQVGNASVTRGKDQVTIEGSLEFKGDMPVSLTVDAKLAERNAIEGQDIAVRMTAAGDLESLTLVADLARPVKAELRATVSSLLDAPEWRGSLFIPTLDARQFARIKPLQSLGGKLEFDGDLERTSFGGELSVIIAETPATLEPSIELTPSGLKSTGTRLLVPGYEGDAVINGRVDWQEVLAYSASVHLRQLRIPAGETPLQVRDGRLAIDGNATSAIATASLPLDQGRINIGAGMEFTNGTVDVDIEWQALRLPLNQRTLFLANGHASLSGTPRDYRFELGTGFQLDQLPGGTLALQGHGSEQQVDAVLESLQWQGGAATGKALVELDARRVTWQVDASGFPVEPVLDTLDGRIGLVASGESKFSAEGPHEFRLGELRGTLNRNPLSGSGKLRFDNGQWIARDIELTVGDARATADGRSHDDGLSLALTVPAINSLDARYEGRVEAQGKWRRNDGNNWVALDAVAENLVLPDFNATRTEVAIDLDAGGESTSRISIALDDVRVAGRGIEAANLDAAGTRASNTITASVQVADGQVHLGGKGAWQGDRWVGELDRFDVGARNAGAWRLAEGSGGTVATSIGMSEVRLERFCLGQDRARLCATADWDGTHWQASADLERARLEYFGALLPAGLDYRGGFDLHASAGNRDGIRATANLDLLAGSVRAIPESADDAEPPPLLEWYGGSANVTLEDRVIDTDATLDLGRSGRLTGGGTIGVTVDDAPAPLDINLQVALQRLDLLAALYPEVNRIKGQFGADLTIEGNLDEPEIRGRAELRNGGLQLARYGLELEDMTVKLVGEGDAVELDAGMASGEGRLDASLSLSERAGNLLAQGNITGERFQASNTRELKLEISPDLDLAADGREIDISGELHVPLARIRPRELSSGTVSASEDQVFVEEEGEDGIETPDRLEVNARVRTTLGEEVDFAGFGLEAGIEGALTVIREPDSPARGEGRLALVDGRYRAYGQRLKLVRGELIYTGQPLDEPGLDIRAVREPTPDITVGVNLRGDLRNPQLDLFSEPPMPQQEQLSWLVLGRPASRQAGDQQEIDSAALALGLSGGAITGELRDRFDLEEATLQDLDDQEEASLVLGKYLSPDLYVSYGIGLFEAANSFRVRYRLSSKWTLETVSGLENSADFLYTIESGR